MIYIYKNDRQSGPYEEHIVLEQLRSGVLSPNDLAVRHGETTWQPLSDIFPEATVPPPPPNAAPEQKRTESPRTQPVVAAAVPATGAPLYRRTLIQKILFGLLFIGFLVALVGAGASFYDMRSPSGNLATDIRNSHFRDLFLYAGIGIFVGTFLTFLAFLLTFKRKVIASGGLRVALRIVFILVLLAGVIDIGIGIGSYFMYTNPHVSASKAAEPNELLKALEEGEAATGPFRGLAVNLPIAAGLMLLGISGILMTTKRGKAAV